MIAQLFLSLLLLAMLPYGLVAARRTPFLGPTIGLAAVTGLYFVWWPQDANKLAHLVGIGRGADLVLYLWVLLSMLVALNLHIRLKAQAELTTKLARALALLESGVGSEGQESEKQKMRGRAHSGGAGDPTRGL